MKQPQLSFIMLCVISLSAVLFAAPPVCRAEADTILNDAKVEQAQPEKLLARQLVQQRPLTIAHRGASQRAPENTLPAFQAAVKAGADLIELDYYHSADGQPVVFHDDTLDRTTNASQVLGKSRAIAATKWAELQQLDAGAWFDKSFAGTPIPSLDDSVRLIQAGSVTLIERKQGDAQTLVRLLQQNDWVDRVVVQAFDWQFLVDCHKLEPHLTLAALGSKQLTADKLRQAKEFGGQVVAWNHKDLDVDAIRQAHKMGLRVWCYTVNSTAAARRLVGMGVDGVITDTPAAIRKAVGDN